MFDFERTSDRLTVREPGTRWLSNGFDGGYTVADAAHNLTVPDGFGRTDLDAYAAERLGEPPAGPTLLTGVNQQHARGGRLGPVVAVVTAGLSNPATLPMAASADDGRTDGADREWRPGTVNIVVGTRRPLSDGGLAGLLATAVEAKTATLSAVAGCTGTTSDAVAVGCPSGDTPEPFAGSATEVGAAVRACVREALLASLASRYEDGPPAPADAEHGVETDDRAAVFQP
ncbi:adenosylcobinamide amidohydrolase [Natronomonas pharaonis DSM 2160]|uniref:Adenosylcobinamide amidohydrolase n=1 Tax=Natronomonas pharaonis (strain ATCC 35678 / DSM 2160 / CIP 103997 / JCM 8858 / NBRC 14720 / NCIMB 2260 / Gabara) TaxID=348780 RepID=A0A1U7EZI7_NATPD|nr:adenosylcobinamide amidohydrolase [Natronomonas pharaonis]CAI50741.1 adenosylcobinamide amidohydrolase [Natronomonas pharaonis DSM 2160]